MRPLETRRAGANERGVTRANNSQRMNSARGARAGAIFPDTRMGSLDPYCTITEDNFPDTRMGSLDSHCTITEDHFPDTRMGSLDPTTARRRDRRSPRVDAPSPTRRPYSTRSNAVSRTRGTTARSRARCASARASAVASPRVARDAMRAPSTRPSIARTSRARTRTPRTRASSRVPRMDADATRPRAPDLHTLERELYAATPRSTSHSLVDRVHGASTRCATMRTRDRVTCALAAHACECACECAVDSRTDVMSLCVALALRRAIAANLEDGSARVVCGYASEGGGAGGRTRASAHAWLEVDGKVVDVCAPGAALCELAVRVGVDFDDESAMVETFGEEALRQSGYYAVASDPERRRPLTVLNVAVPIGGSRAGNPKPASGLTLKAPPDSVEGAREAVERVEYFRERVLALGDAGERAFIDSAPPEVRACYERIVSARVETVDSRRERLARAALG